MTVRRETFWPTTSKRFDGTRTRRTAHCGSSLSLDAAAQGHLQNIIALAVHTATFDFLCVLNGTTKVRDITESGRFKLSYVTAEGDIVLNDPAADPLHGVYNEGLVI
jgi:hypothetical protein